GLVPPAATSCFTDASPSPKAVMIGIDVVLRMKLVALLLNVAVAFDGAVKPLASILVPTTRNEPELVLATMSAAPISEIVNVFNERLTMVAAAKAPVAPNNRIASPAG